MILIKKKKYSEDDPMNAISIVAIWNILFLLVKIILNDKRNKTMYSKNLKSTI